MANNNLTLHEKINLVSGKDFWHTHEVTGVRSIMVSDGPHGLRKNKEDAIDPNESIVAVCYPSASCFACSFDTELIGKMGEHLGTECCAENVDVLLGPAINIKRSPLCGRNFEYFSEDPFLTGTLATHYINGVQSKGVGTSLKHFAANSQERHRVNVDANIDERALREIYLKGFEMAVKGAQPTTLMCAYNKINGEFCSQNKWLLTDVLRGDWGFKGFVMSDWGAVSERYKGVVNGLDLEMPGSYGVGYRNIKKAYDEGKVTDEDLDKRCQAIMGVVDRIKPDKNAVFDREAHHQFSKEVALNSMVLLKNNDNILPLDKAKSICFIGEFAQKPRYQGGGSSHINSWQVTPITTIHPEIPYAKGFSINSSTVNAALEKEAVALAEKCDVAVIFAGLSDAIESEAFDRANMQIPENQNSLIRKVSLANPNTVVVLHNGSPVEMPWINNVKAVFEAYLGGEASHEAVSDLIFGVANPCGKLAESFPVKLSDNPSYFNFPGVGKTVEYRESIFVGYRYYDKMGKVLFPFGHGLSYTEYEYSNLVATKNQVTLDVTNVGKRAGSEIVQLYIAKKDSAIFRPEKELKGFAKVHLEAGETKQVTISLDDSAYQIYNNGFVTESGEYQILVGASSADIRLDATVMVESDDIITIDEKVNDIYSNSDVRFATKKDFEALLGREIVVHPTGKPYTVDDVMGDITDSKLGKFYNKVVDTFVGKTDGKLGAGATDKAFAKEMPVRQIATMTNGAFNEHQRDALLGMLNDEGFVKNGIKFVKGYFKK